MASPFLFNMYIHIIITKLPIAENPKNVDFFLFFGYFFNNNGKIKQFAFAYNILFCYFKKMQGVRTGGCILTIKTLSPF